MLGEVIIAKLVVFFAKYGLEGNTTLAMSPQHPLDPLSHDNTCTLV